MEYDNTNRGVLFKNDRKEKDSHPDYKGNIDVDGEEFWISAWIKEGKKGKFMSLSVQPKEPAEAVPTPQPQRQQAQAKTRGQQFSDMDDDIPF
jgi:hypothetical protein